MTELKIYNGEMDYVLPSIEGCLEDSDGKFDSTQNAVRIYEWLRDLEGLAPVLRAVRKENDEPLVEERRLGVQADVFPMRNTAEVIFEMEQTIIALPDLKASFEEAVEVLKRTPGDSVVDEMKRLNEEMMQYVLKVSYFNACAMFNSTPIPKRFILENIATLDYLVAMVATQRRMTWYETTNITDLNTPEGLYQKRDLMNCVSKIHQAHFEMFYQSPKALAKELFLIDEEFFKQCAMAYSFVTDTAIPAGYVSPSETKVFHWAVKMLTATKEAAKNMKIRPQFKNVINMFGK